MTTTTQARIEAHRPKHDRGTRADWMSAGRRVMDFAPSLGKTVRKVVVTLDDGTEASASAVEALYHRNDTEAVH